MRPSLSHSEASEQQEQLLAKDEPLEQKHTKLSRFKAILEEGHAAAGVTITVALIVGSILGFALPTDKTIPGASALHAPGLPLRRTTTGHPHSSLLAAFDAMSCVKG